MIDALVTVCQVEHRASALRMLHAARDESHQESLAHAVAAVPADDGDAWRGLFVAEESKPPGAAWVQPLPGNTAVIWPPPPDCPAFDALLRTAAAYVDAQRIALAQIIVGGDEGFSPELLEQCGFAHLAELNYMVADSAINSGSHALGHFTFLPRAGDYPERLAALVELTYVGTKDCPRLDGVRRIDDVLAGYRAQGRRLPNHWYIVRYCEHNEPADSQDLGVLILAEHPGTESWELVYMGVIPRARGRGLGPAIVRFALDTAARGGAQRLVLAVDAANAPALAMYLRSGFVAWDRRFVYARMGA